VNVGQLIEALSRLDPDLPVNVLADRGRDDRAEDVEADEVEVTAVRRMLRPDDGLGRWHWRTYENVRCVTIR